MAEADDLRAFIREIMVRFDRRTMAFERELITQRKQWTKQFEAQRAEFSRELAEQRAEWRARHSETRAYLDAIRENGEEMRAEARVQREALFRILDRLDGRGGTAPA